MLGPRIASLRRRIGMSQSELAARLKVSPSAVGMYEQGRREPSVETLVEMARVFGVSTDYLLKGIPQECREVSLLDEMILDRIGTADQRFGERKTRPFSRQELAVLFAAMLIDP